ncbi:hypothetical protein HMPREF3201_01762 [Megasphaera sp. MJR8396C]|nr:hypothetical protein HMPREF3201_01762 [Megasphaera sp. MJR8396C]
MNIFKGKSMRINRPYDHMSKQLTASGAASSVFNQINAFKR